MDREANGQLLRQYVLGFFTEEMENSSIDNFFSTLEKFHPSREKFDLRDYVDTYFWEKMENSSQLVNFLSTLRMFRDLPQDEDELSSVFLDIFNLLSNGHKINVKYDHYDVYSIYPYNFAEFLYHYLYPMIKHSSESKSKTSACKKIKKSDKFYPHKHQEYTDTFHEICEEDIIDKAWRIAYYKHQDEYAKKEESYTISEQEKEFIEGMKKYVSESVKKGF